jgi:hypothetical protein
MKNTLRNLLSIALFGALAACDYVDQPLPPPGSGGGGGNGGTDGVPRRVLLEEFTGHLCDNCPEAAITAKQLQNIYGPENLVVVAIHAGAFFSEPANPPFPNGAFSSDHRTVAGNTYATTFGVFFLPTGAVSRKPYNQSMLISHAAWSSAVADIIGDPAYMDLWFSELDYDAGQGTVTPQVRIAVARPLETTTYRLVVQLLENRVVDWQLNGNASPPEVPDYEHMHMLRANLNGTWGQDVLAGNPSVGDTLTVDLPAYTLDPAWNWDECSLVAYVYDNGTDEVLQVVERKFVP